MYDPTAEREITLGDELERLDAELADVEAAEQAGDLSGDASRLAYSEYDAAGRALYALAEAHGHDATITVRGLSAGEFARVEDRVAVAREQRNTQAGLQAYHRNVYAAAGLVSAPFFDPDEVTDPPWDARTPDQRLDARVTVVAEQNPSLVKWLFARVDEATTPDEGNWRPSADSTTDAAGE